jgi:polyhydroxyalkanoate synthase
LPLFLDILWRETEADPVLRNKAFAGLRRYQHAKRVQQIRPSRIAASAGSARLLQYGTENPDFRRAPVVLVPSLVNPPTVLDLSAERSLLRYLARRGHHASLVDWGTPKAEDAGLSLAGHAVHRLMPLLAGFPTPPILVGYCLGGTLSLALAALGKARAVATIAAPWIFSAFPDADRVQVAALWAEAKPMCARLGYVPMEVLQSGFWALDTARTIRKYAAFADMQPGSDRERAFLALEDWANAGPPLTYAAGEELFERLYAGDATGTGQWLIEGRQVIASSLSCPSLSVRSSTDRIVPAASSPQLDENWTLPLGHVGMIVGGSAPERLWAPLSGWLSSQGG